MSQGFTSQLPVPLPTAQGGTGVTNTNWTAASLTFSPTTQGIVGTTTNDSAGAGYVGEVISSTATSVNISHATGTNVTSISLTAGDWDVFGSVLANPPVAQYLTYTAGAISTTSATFPGKEYYVNISQNAGTPYFNEIGLAVPTRRISIASTTTVYLVIQSGFSGASGTGTSNGSIIARRRR